MNRSFVTAQKPMISYTFTYFHTRKMQSKHPPFVRWEKFEDLFTGVSAISFKRSWTPGVNLFAFMFT